MEILDQIDAATGCQECGGPLGASPSDDFCREDCQIAWRASRVGAPARLATPVQVPRFSNNTTTESHIPAPPPMWASPKYADRADVFREHMRTRPHAHFLLVEPAGSLAEFVSADLDCMSLSFREVRLESRALIDVQREGGGWFRIYKYFGLFDADGQGVTGNTYLVGRDYSPATEAEHQRQVRARAAGR